MNLEIEIRLLRLEQELADANETIQAERALHRDKNKLLALLVKALLNDVDPERVRPLTPLFRFVANRIGVSPDEAKEILSDCGINPAMKLAEYWNGVSDGEQDNKA